MHIFVLLAAESETSVLAGSAGWAGAGLLGAVLGWLLLKHLPEKDKQIKDLIDLHLKTETEQRANHLDAELKQRLDHIAMQKEQRVEFKETLTVMMEHSKTQLQSLAEALRQDFVELKIAVKELSKALENKKRE